VYSKYLFILPTGFIFYIGFSQGVPAFSLPLAMCHHRLVVLSYFSVVGACSFTQQCPQKPTDNERRVNWIVFTLWDQEDTGLRVVSGLLFRPCSLRGKSFRSTCKRVNFSIWIHRWVAAHWNIRPNARDMCFISNLESKPSPQSINSICKFPSEGSLKVWAQNKRDDELSLCRGSSDSTDFLSS